MDDTHPTRPTRTSIGNKCSPKSVEAQRSIENPNEDQNEIQSSNNSPYSLIQSFISVFVDDITEIPLVVVEIGALMNVTGAQSIIEDPNEDQYGLQTSNSKI